MEFPLFIAYNMDEMKIGCALVQPMLGATLSGGDLSFHFDTNLWELNPSKCKLFTIRDQQQFEAMKKMTTGKPRK